MALYKIHLFSLYICYAEVYDALLSTQQSAANIRQDNTLCSKNHTISYHEIDHRINNSEHDTKECAQSKNKYYYCAPGCFANMIRNGICNIECYNPMCNYDYDDCNGLIIHKILDSSANIIRVNDFEYDLNTKIQGNVLINELSQIIYKLYLKADGNLMIKNYLIENPDNFFIFSSTSLNLNFYHIKILKSNAFTNKNIFQNLLFHNFSITELKESSSYIQITAKTQKNTPKPFSFNLDGDFSYKNQDFSQKRTLSSNKNPQKTDESLLICNDGYAPFENACFICPNNTYSFSVIRPQCCFLCDKSMKCLNGKVFPSPGYWRHKQVKEVFRKCPNEKISCIGHNEDGFTKCAKGYKGDYCDECDDHYGNLGLHICSKCPNKAANGFALVIIIIVILIVAILMIKTTVSTALDSSQLYSICLKIGVNYFHIIYLRFQYKFRWPEEFGLLSGSDEDDVRFFVSIKCLFNEKIDDKELFYIKVGLMVSAPILLFIISSIGLWIVKKFKLVHTVDQYVISSYLVTFLLAYPFVITYSISPLACSSPREGIPNLYNEGDIRYDDYKYLIEIQSIKCDYNNHYSKIIWVTIFGVFVWGFGVPIYIFYKLYGFRKNLFDEKTKCKYGFLFNGYLHNYYFWDFIILTKKILIIFLTVFMESKFKTYLQSLLLITFLTVFFILQLYFKPFIKNDLNEIEKLASLAALITITLEAIYSEINPDSAIAYAILTIIFIVNLIFFIYWIKSMSKDFVKFLTFSLKFLKKIYWKSQNTNELVLKKIKYFPHLYMKEYHKLYTQIHDNEIKIENYLGKSISLMKLYREIMQTDLEDYENNLGPVFR